MRHRSGKASEAAGTLTGPIFSGMMPPLPLGIADASMFSQCPYNTAATKGLAGRFLNMPSPVLGAMTVGTSVLLQPIGGRAVRHTSPQTS